MENNETKKEKENMAGISENKFILGLVANALIVIFAGMFGNFMQNNNASVSPREEETRVKLNELTLGIQTLSTQVKALDTKIANLENRTSERYTQTDAKEDWSRQDVKDSRQDKYMEDIELEIDRLKQKDIEFDSRIFRYENRNSPTSGGGSP